MTNDWRSGFLWIGNHVALDFVNTRPVIAGSPVELLPDGAALARWLAVAGLIPERRRRSVEPLWRDSPQMRQLIVFREWLREAVVEIENGRPVPSGFVKELNRHLAERPLVNEVATQASGLVLRRKFEPRDPADALGLLARLAAELITQAGSTRMRRCDACILHFLDTSRKGTRRWCSMSLCGNRVKVAAYTARKRGDPAELKSTTSSEE